MKNFLLIYAFLLIDVAGIAQSNSWPVITDPIEIMPSFPGGEEALTRYITENIKYPEKERLKGIAGKCIIGFVVEKDGAVTDIKVVKGVEKGPGCDKEALRIVGNMPNWNPGIQGGKKVRVQFNLPINFSLEK